MPWSVLPCCCCCLWCCCWWWCWCESPHIPPQWFCKYVNGLVMFAEITKWKLTQNMWIKTNEKISTHKWFTNRNARLTFIRQRQRDRRSKPKTWKRISLMAKCCSHPSDDVVITCDALTNNNPLKRASLNQFTRQKWYIISSTTRRQAVCIVYPILYTLSQFVGRWDSNLHQSWARTVLKLLLYICESLRKTDKHGK